MSRFMSVVWVMQFFALLAISLVLLVAPETVPWLLYDCDVLPAVLSSSESIACGDATRAPPNTPDGWKELLFLLASVQLLVPFLLAQAFFSLHAFMREDLRVRRTLARIFALTFAALLYCLRYPAPASGSVQIPDIIAHPFQGIPPLRICLLLGWICALVFLVASNLAMGLWPLPRSARRLSGSADTRPSQLWILWLVQGVLFCVLALWLSRTHLVTWVVHLKGTPEYGSILTPLQTLAPPLFLSLGLFSFMGLRASREWGWRALCRLFVSFYVSWFLLLLAVWQQEFKKDVLFFLIPLLLLLAGNFAFWRKSDIWFTEEVGEGPDGWVMVDLLVGSLMLVATLLTRRRPLYAHGVGVRGTFQVSDYTHDYTPGRSMAHDFFAPRQRFEARMRFATEGPDDAGLAARGVALQLSAPGLGNFELMMSTGAYSAAENIVQFALLHLARKLGGSAERLLWKHRPHMREGMLAALRRAPGSFTQLHYYAQTVRFWVASDGSRHLVRYRLVPGGREPCHESGLPVKEDGAPLRLERRRRPGERRPSDYLKQELKRRLEGKRQCTLVLEAQFHTPKPGDSNHWFNPATDWHTEEHPWMRIGQLVLDEVLPDEQAELLHFNPANVPPSLGIPTSRGFFDYRSIADSEKRVHQRIQKTRQWMTEAFGPPSLEPRPHEPT